MESLKRMSLMEGEIEEERFLFLGSKYNLFCIDLKKTEEKHGSKCSELSFDPLVAEVAWSTNIHATSDYLPFGMSSTRFDFKAAASSSSSSSTTSTSSSGSDILLIGGELQPPPPSPYCPGEFQLPSSPYCGEFQLPSSPYAHASREVYKLVPEISSNGDVKDIRIQVADATVPRMLTGKACPIVEEIKGNLYVLHSRFIHGSFDAQPEIPFEVFESKQHKWRTLPIPPFFAARSATVIYAHAVIGIYFVIETSKECFFFDTLKEMWRCCPDKITAQLINRLPMTLPWDLGLGFEYNNEMLFVGISLLIEPSAYLVGHHGTIFARQSLQEVIFKGILPHPDKPLGKNVLIPLKSVEDNVMRMCACSIVSSNDFPGGCEPLAVSFFSAKISPSSQQLHEQLRKQILEVLDGMDSGELLDMRFLDVSVERKFFFRVPHLDCFFNGPALLL